jgi:hypothetical protein
MTTVASELGQVKYLLAKPSKISTSSEQDFIAFYLQQ